MIVHTHDGRCPTPSDPLAKGRKITLLVDRRERLIGIVQGYRDAFHENGPAEHLAQFAEECLSRSEA